MKAKDLITGISLTTEAGPPRIPRRMPPPPPPGMGGSMGGSAPSDMPDGPGPEGRGPGGPGMSMDDFMADFPGGPGGGPEGPGGPGGPRGPFSPVEMQALTGVLLLIATEVASENTYDAGIARKLINGEVPDAGEMQHFLDEAGRVQNLPPKLARVMQKVAAFVNGGGA